LLAQRYWSPQPRAARPHHHQTTHQATSCSHVGMPESHATPRHSIATSLRQRSVSRTRGYRPQVPRAHPSSRRALPATACLRRAYQGRASATKCRVAQVTWSSPSMNSVRSSDLLDIFARARLRTVSCGRGGASLCPRSRSLARASDPTKSLAFTFGVSACPPRGTSKTRREGSGRRDLHKARETKSRERPTNSRPRL
jgi:hypothetical protein